MIHCGWCGVSTPDIDRCANCGHRDPRTPWEQRGLTVPTEAATEGRPTLDEHEIRARYAEAVAVIRAAGSPPTIEAIAERLDRSPRTVREWRKRFNLR